MTPLKLTEKGLASGLELGGGLVCPGEVSCCANWISAVLFLGFWEGCCSEPGLGVFEVVTYDASLYAVDVVDVDE